MGATLPSRLMPKTDSELLRREKLRADRELPMCRRSSVEIAHPTSVVRSAVLCGKLERGVCRGSRRRTGGGLLGRPSAAGPGTPADPIGWDPPRALF
eukprot:g12982.t1